MWLRAKEIDSIGSNIGVEKDSFINSENISITTVHESIPATMMKNFPEHLQKSQPRGFILSYPDRSWITHGVMHLSPNCKVALHAGKIYAGKIHGPLVASQIKNIPNPCRPGIVLTGDSVSPEALNQLLAEESCPDIELQKIMNALRLRGKTLTSWLDMMYQTYSNENRNTPIYEQDYMDYSLLYEQIYSNRLVINKGLDTAGLQKAILTQTHTMRGLIAQLNYLRALRNDFPISIVPTAIDESLFAAIKSGDMPAVQLALANGAHVNAIDKASEFLYSPLQLAIVLDQLAIAKLLAQVHNVKLDYFNSGPSAKSALDLAVEKSEQPGYQELIGIIKSKLEIVNNKVQPSLEPSYIRVATPIIQQAQQKMALLHKRDAAVLTATYTSELQEFLKKSENKVARSREDWLQNVVEYRHTIDKQKQLIDAAITACMTGNSLQAIDRIKNSENSEALWQLFCACNPLQIAIKHKQTKAVAYLLDNNVEYFHLLSHTQEDLAQDLNTIQLNSIDLTENSMLDVLASHMLQDLEPKMHNHGIKHSQEKLSVSMAIFAHSIIEKVNNTSAYDFNSGLNAKLDDYFREHELAFDSYVQQGEDAFNKLSAGYLDIIAPVLQEHGSKLQANL